MNRTTMPLPIVEVNTYLACCEKFTTLRKVISILSHIDTFVRNIRIKVLLIAITLLNSSASFLTTGTRVTTIVIDPGHGGRDPGTSGKNTKEKDIALKISLKFGAYIEKNMPEVKVIYK